MAEGTDRNSRSSLEEVVEGWLSSSDAVRAAEGFDELVGTWGMQDVLCTLAERHWNERAKVAKRLLGSDRFRYVRRPAGEPLTVAYYYPSIATGGAQRMAAETCNIWASSTEGPDAEYSRVVLITDDRPLDDEYALDPRVHRAFLPPASRDGYRSRYEAWQRVLEDEGVDAVVSGIWMQGYALWDILAAKGADSHPAFILFDSSFTVRPYIFPGDNAQTLIYIYQLVDGVSVQSECDCSYVGRFCANTRYIPNFLGYLAGNSENAAPEEHSIIWTGRIAEIKQPMDLIRMMGLVVEEVPDARLYLVGGEDKGFEEELRGEVRRLGLEERIVFTGFTTDVDAWYRRASVCVCTSKMEGFSLTTAEALSHSLPVVMYDLPWLELVRDGRGIRTVEQGRYDLLAEEVVRLLQNPEGARRLGREGRGQIDDLLQVDIGAEWRALFRGIDPDARPVGWDSDERILFQYATEFQEEGKQELRSRNAELKSEFRSCSNRLAARIDVKNAGGADNDVEVLELSDPDATLIAPGWFCDDKGTGHVLESVDGSLDVKLRCIGDGELSIVLRGQDVKGEDGARVPVWIDCTSLAVDGRELLGGTRTVWHNKPLRHKLSVDDGQVVEVSLTWHSHDEAGLAAEKERVDALKTQIKALKSENASLQRAGKKQEKELAAAEDEVRALRSSNSWKVGRFITWLPRKLKALLK